MTGDEGVLAVIDALDAAGIPYMLVGSFSTNYYGIPRSTRDADFVIELGSLSISSLAKSLGPQFRLDPQPSFETVTMTTRHVFEVVGNSFTIELFRLSDQPHDQERFRRRQRAHLMGREISLPTVEDVIITKLRWTSLGKRSKDWEDVRNVIAVQGDRIDWDYVHAWCDRHKTRDVLDDIRRSIPTM